MTLANINPETFYEDMRKLPIGGRIVYHTGNLIFDRDSYTNVKRIAGLAHTAYKEGIVILVQRRAAPEVCDYIAQRRDDSKDMSNTPDSHKGRFKRKRTRKTRRQRTAEAGLEDYSVHLPHSMRL